jgi:hypothetical protein
MSDIDSPIGNSICATITRRNIGRIAKNFVSGHSTTPL